MLSARASHAVDIPSLRSSPRKRCLRFASLAFSFRRVPQTPSRSHLGVCLGPRARSIFVRFARHHSGVANQSHVSHARVSSAFASRAVGFPSRRSLPRQCCLRFASCAFPSRRVPQAPRSSLASLVVTTASQARLLRSRVVGARLPRRRPSLASQVATVVFLAFRVSHTSHLGACHHDAACALRLSWLRPGVTLDAVGPRSLRSSSRRRRESLAHLSRSHVVGVHLSCRLPYPTLSSSCGVAGVSYL